MKTIYTITCCTDDFENRRCFGWFSTPKEAQEAVHNNWHITECLYDILLVERSNTGIHGRSQILMIYKADYKNKKWVGATASLMKLFKSSNYNGIG